MKTGIVLIGMAGCGKSTLGPPLATALGYEFVDLDECIRRKEGGTIQSIIDAYGDDGLLQREEQAMSELSLEGKVVAPGGSIIYLPMMMERLKRNSVLVFLDEDFENILARLKNARERGIVGFKTKSLFEIFEERRRLYLQHSDIVVKPAGRIRERVIAEVMTEYQRITGS